VRVHSRVNPTSLRWAPPRCGGSSPAPGDRALRPPGSAVHADPSFASDGSAPPCTALSPVHASLRARGVELAAARQESQQESDESEPFHWRKSESRAAH
jgi:hypothetical protein